MSVIKNLFILSEEDTKLLPLNKRVAIHMEYNPSWYQLVITDHSGKELNNIKRIVL